MKTLHPESKHLASFPDQPFSRARLQRRRYSDILLILKMVEVLLFHHRANGLQYVQLSFYRYHVITRRFEKNPRCRYLNPTRLCTLV